MNAGKKLFEEGYIKANLIPANLNLYVLTKEKITILGSSSILSDIFVVIGSIFWGAYFSSIITIGSLTKEEISRVQTVITYKSLFFYVAICFSLLFLASKAFHYFQIYGITRSGIKIDE